jgi:UDP-N-acetylglucosamine 1-carboxyvinyltransferase
MARYKIIGKTSLNRQVSVSGAKNEALKLIPLTILLSGKTIIENVPAINDVLVQLKIVESIGGKYSFSDNRLEIDCQNIQKSDITSAYASRFRASIVLAGPLLARFGQVNCPYPGGCLIGARPIDTHLDAFRQLGAKIKENTRHISIRIDEITANMVILKERSVSATENIALFCAGMPITVEIQNCATEPEVQDLLRNIQMCGAKVEGIGSKNIKITGTKSLKCNSLRVMPDRIEAATFLIAMIATGGEGTISPFPETGLEPVIEVLKQTGAKFEITNGKAHVYKNGLLKPFKISTAPHPGFPTDLQSPMSLIASRCEGTSYIEETMYENRLTYINELKSMGMKADLKDSHHAVIYGPTKFVCAVIPSLDLRSGITLLLAGIMAEGETIIENAQIIDRGYEKIDQKLTTLGASIVRLS